MVGRLNLSRMLLICSWCSLFYMANARADFYLHSWEDHRSDAKTYDLGIQLGYYSTSQNFDSNSVLRTPTGFQGYNRFETDFNGSMGITPTLTGFARLTWARVQVLGTARPGVAYGLADQTVGLNLKVLGTTMENRLAKYHLHLQIQADLPAYDNTNAYSNQIPFMGDGSIDMTGGAFFVIDFIKDRERTFSLDFGVGATYRTQGFSAAIPWSVSARYLPTGDGVFGTLSLTGVQSLATDKAVFTTSSSLGTGGSFVTNAINPAIVSIGGEAGYQFIGLGHDVGLVAQAAQTLTGQAVPCGLYISVGLRVALGAHSTPRFDFNNDQGLKNYPEPRAGVVDYHFEAKVLKTNDRLNLIKIDKGRDDGVEEGQVFDIFSIKANGTAREAVARTKVSSVQAKEAVLTITEFFKEVWIEENFLAKRPIQ